MVGMRYNTGQRVLYPINSGLAADLYIKKYYWRGTEAAITAPTRNRLGEQSPQGFESLPLRHLIK